MSFRISGSTTTQFQMPALVKVTAIPAALMLLTVAGAEKINPLTQRNISLLQNTLSARVALVALTTLYVAAAYSIFGPLYTQKKQEQTKKLLLSLPPPTEKTKEEKNLALIQSAPKMSQEEILSVVRDLMQALKNPKCFEYELRAPHFHLRLNLKDLEIREQVANFCQKIQKELLPLTNTDKNVILSPKKKENRLIIIKDYTPKNSNPVKNLERIPVYLEDVHGLNGEKMQLKKYQVLMSEYVRLLSEIHKINLEKTVCCHTDLTHVKNLLLGKTGNNSRQRYEAMVDTHQQLINAYTKDPMKYSKETIRISRALAHVRMIPEIQSFQESLVHEHIRSHDKLTPENFHTLFARRNEDVRDAPSEMKMGNWSTQYTKLKGAMSTCDYFKENPPNLRKVETWKNNKKVRQIYYMRHATPNVPSYWTWTGATQVNPAYEEFLRAAAERKEGVLYAAHQRLGDNPKHMLDVGEHEGGRCDLIVGLEKPHPNLMVLFQSVENDLFMKGKETFEELIKGLVESFYEKEGDKRNRLPEKLQNYKGFKEGMYQLGHYIHKIFFGERNNIDQIGYDYYSNTMKVQYEYAKHKKSHTTEWQAFIMLFYHFQREMIKLGDFNKEYPIKYVNTGCKDDYDRGGGQNMTTDRFHHHQVHDSKVPTEDLEATISSIQAPPIQGKGIPAIKYRLHPALMVSKMLADYEKESPGELKKMRIGGWRLSSYNVRRHEGQNIRD